MPLELFTNAANPTTARATTLGAAMLAGATSLTVASSTGFPAAVAGVSQFRVLIESELFLVTNVAGLTWTVVGAQEGTTAAGHALSVAVSATITAGALANAPVSGSVVLVSGRYYDGRMFSKSDVPGTYAANVLHVTPFLPSRNVTIDRIGVEVLTATAAGGLARLGLYRAGANGAPGPLMLDAGTVVTDTAGAKEITMSAALVAGDVYYLAIVASLAVSLRIPDAQANMVIGYDNVADSSPQSRQGFTVAHTFAALPATFGAFGTTAIYAGVKVRVA